MRPDEEAQALEQRAAWRSRLEHTPFGETCGLTFTTWNPDQVVLEVAFDERLASYSDTFHGGVLATAIDAAAIGAVMAGEDFRQRGRFFTASMTVNFLAANRGEDLVVSARCTRRGGSMNFVHTTACSGTSGRVLAEGLVTIAFSVARDRAT